MNWKYRERPDLGHVSLQLFSQEGGTLPGPMALGNALEKIRGHGTHSVISVHSRPRAPSSSHLWTQPRPPGGRQSG